MREDFFLHFLFDSVCDSTLVFLLLLLVVVVTFHGVHPLEPRVDLEQGFPFARVRIVHLVAPHVEGVRLDNVKFVEHTKPAQHPP